ncbi:MAG: antibiotic biosynthesis monooxygenase [Actinomycetota bacterium]
MFARVARYEVPPERMDEAVKAFQEAATEIEGLEGLKGGSVLVDAEDGVIMSMTFWETRTAMLDSEVKAAGLRRQAAKQVDGNVVSVHCLDVVSEIGTVAPTTA